MKKTFWITVLVLALGAAGAIASGMTDFYVSGKWRYRLTVEIETPEGVKTGSAVHELSNSDSNVEILDFPQSVNPPEFKGEAVVVDLGKRGVVFAILPTDPYWIFLKTFPVSDATGTEGIKYYNSLPVGLKKDLPLDQYPPFVMFKDMNDPKSVTLVKGHRFDADKQEHIPVDSFETLFGPGVRLKSITVEITEDPVTWGVADKHLKWLDALRHRKARLSGSNSIAITTNDLADNLGAGSFSAGELK